jgi:hypothetical protein
MPGIIIPSPAPTPIPMPLAASPPPPLPLAAFSMLTAALYLTYRSMSPPMALRELRSSMVFWTSGGGVMALI